MSLTSPHDVFVAGLKKAYYVKQQGAENLKQILQSSTDHSSREALENHMGTTQSHVGILEKVFTELSVDPEADSSEGLDYLVSECQTLIDQAQGDVATNFLVNEAALKIEHLEIAILSGLQAQAELLGNQTVINSLEQIVSDDKEALEKAESTTDELVQQAQGEQEEPAQPTEAQNREDAAMEAHKTAQPQSSQEEINLQDEVSDKSSKKGQ